MLVKTKESLSKIDHRLYAALLFMGLCPTLYTTLRTYFLGALPGDWAYSIAGQLSWINLIYEVMNEAVILPLYFFMASVLADKKAFANRVRSGLVVSFGVYAACSIPVAVFINPLLQFMAGVWQPTLVGIALLLLLEIGRCQYESMQYPYIQRTIRKRLRQTA